MVGLQTEPSQPSVPIPEKEISGPISTKEAVEPPVQPEPSATKVGTAASQETSAVTSNDTAIDTHQNNLSAPTVTVESPSEPASPEDTSSNLPQQSEQEKEQTDAMPPRAPPETHSRFAPVSATGGDTDLLPPPPPRAENDNSSSTIAEPVEERPKWLLPPIAPRFKGKKCLVLDLDETLVHSSFKVG